MTKEEIQEDIAALKRVKKILQLTSNQIVQGLYNLANEADFEEFDGDTNPVLFQSLGDLLHAVKTIDKELNFRGV